MTDDPAPVWRLPLPTPPDPLGVVRWLRDEPRPVALSGAWAGGGLILTSHPVRHADAHADDPFARLDEPAPEHPEAVGGGWFGWLGFGLAHDLEPVPPPPPRPVPLPRFDLAFHDHVVRRDAAGRWWFEALPTPAREAFLTARLDLWRARLAGRPPPPPPGPLAAAGPLRAVAPGTAGHAAAVAEAVARIEAGDLSQANLCLRLEADLGDSDPLELWIAAVTRADPAYAAYVGAAGHAVVSLSPELFLRRRGRAVQTRPIKGTGTDAAALAASAKDRAENVMIVDLMRNDLGRVCAYGSVRVTALCQVEAAAGVLHLVSTVEGHLRPGVGDGGLLRATFPPGSVTGAPKVQALSLIHALEATGREAYCGAVGMRTAAGLELNVAIRTLETRAGRLWLGAGGGIVADSDPLAEAREALAKARGVADAAGLTPAAAAEARPALPPIERRPRPDPARGLLETILVADGRPVALAAHLARLQASAAALGLEMPAGLGAEIAAAATGWPAGGVRVVLGPAGLAVGVRGVPEPGTTRLHPVVIPGGLGPHKWADRRLIDALSGPGSTPLICDLDGTVLEAGYAAVLVLSDGVLVAPPLDGRALPSVSRALALAAARRAGLTTATRPVTLAQARDAEALILCSALRGPHSGVLASGPAPPAAAVICDRLRSRWGPAHEEEA